MSIIQLKADETFSGKTEINGRKVVSQWSVKKDKSEKSPRFAVTTEFDFTQCSEAEIIGLAMRGVVIEVQRQFRELAAAKGFDPKVNPFKSVNVKSAIVDATRKSADPVARAKSAMAKLTPAQQKAILAAFAKAEKKSA